MKKEVVIEEIADSDLEHRELELREAATIAADHAYAPYSEFRVGAALLLDDGRILRGSNQENAAYPSGICAERNVVFAAGANYPEAVPMTLAIIAMHHGEVLEEPATPCGACLQVLWQYQERYGSELTLLLIGKHKHWRVKGVGQLLPFAFSSLQVPGK